MFQVTPNQSLPMNTRYCANCKYFLNRPKKNTEGYDKLCTRFYTLNVVDGSVKYPTAFEMRDSFDKCGMQARYFDGLTTQDNLLLHTPSMEYEQSILKKMDDRKKNENKNKE